MVIMMYISSCRDLLIYPIIAMFLHSPKVLNRHLNSASLNPSYGKGPVNYWVRTFLPILSPEFLPPLVVTEPLSPAWSNPH